ncbi:hypothetical protein BJ684DRAFT_18772 [Piptocephalis cylindrospora]|uniref:peptidylprolyl isomerase n=1 Tax=Piptocephalis cylindrospora TaxID=1907219 RepID=A0A4P9Y763_9FUNG|nr:hypothetical protein BJ684DRAFT_18772 [Piptocephalis cylindrospora]|eukprot:RKP14843.1 hypothetical protein BJ684DRAFT_18772 [Piptocephalis cylindrospora]
MSQLVVGFWGMHLLPGETYQQVVSTGFRVTMAAYGAEKPKGGDRSCVQVGIDGQTFTLATLLAGKVEQQQLNVSFLEGEDITLSVTGNSAVHLTGNYMIIDDESGCEDDEDDFDSEEEEDFDFLTGGSDDEDEEMDEGRIVELLTEETENKKGTQTTKKETENKKRKEAPAASTPEATPAGKRTKEQETVKAEEPAKLSKAEKKRRAKEAREAEEAKKAPKEEAKKAPKEEAASKKRTLAAGVVVEDIELGKGAKATRGKRIGMRYIGRLVRNGKVFDKNVSGKPFYFKLGVGEVIRGWDIGVEGMMVGGKRQITLPAAAGYGRSGAPPDIPRNADLQFDVQLMAIQ